MVSSSSLPSQVPAMTGRLILELLAIAMVVIVAVITLWRIWARGAEKLAPPAPPAEERTVLSVDLSDRDR